MSKKFVVIETKGKQYKLAEGDVISVDLMDEEPQNKITLQNVLLLSENNKVQIGQPYLDVSVNAEVIAHERDKKVHVFKFKKKTGYKKKQGHKQNYTTIKIISIGKASKATKKSASKEESKNDKETEKKS